MKPLLLVVILLLVLSGPYVNAGPVGNFFKKVGQSISKPLQSQPSPPPPPQSTHPQPMKTPHATRRPSSRAAPAAATTAPGVAQPSHPPKKKRLLALCGGFQPRIWKKQKLVCPTQFRSQAGKAWSRVRICRKRTSISMSPVLRPGPS